MTSVLITIEMPDGPLDLSVPAGFTIEQLLGVVAPEPTRPEALRGWTLATLCGTPLDPSQTIELSGVLDGARLSLVPAGVEHPIDRRPSTAFTRVSPQDRGRRVIPDRTSTPERITTALGAMIGRHRPPNTKGPFDRMRVAWKWTDHERRLGWLLSRPRIHRSIFVGVVGHRSDEVAESLADTLTAARFERVVLVDGGMGGGVTRRLQRPGGGFEAIESGLRRRDVTSVERDLLFGRTDRGTLAVPIDPTAALPDTAAMRRLCDSLVAHAGLVVVDCGGFEQPNATLLERSDQIVVSTTGPIPRFGGQTIAAIWGDTEPLHTGDLHACHPVSDDPISVMELAVVLASGWAAIDAATPVPLGL